MVALEDEYMEDETNSGCTRGYLGTRNGRFHFNVHVDLNDTQKRLSLVLSHVTTDTVSASVVLPHRVHRCDTLPILRFPCESLGVEGQ